MRANLALFRPCPGDVPGQREAQHLYLGAKEGDIDLLAGEDAFFHIKGFVDEDSPARMSLRALTRECPP